MNKLLIASLILISSLMAEKLEITGDGVRLWGDWNKRITPIALLAPGGEYEIVDRYCPYYKVEVLTGKRKGETLFVWSECISNDTVTGVGVTGRTRPKKSKETENGVIYPGNLVKVLEKIVSRYYIKSSVYNEFTGLGWVWAGASRIIK